MRSVGPFAYGLLIGSPVMAENPSLSSLLLTTQEALNVAAVELRDSPIPPLSALTLDLVVGEETRGGASVEVVVLSAGGSESVSKKRKISLTLTPARGDAEISRGEEIADGLVAALRSATEAVQKATTFDPPLEAEALSVSFALGEEIEGETGLGFNLFAWFRVEGEAGIKSATDNTITFSFEH